MRKPNEATQGQVQPLLHDVASDHVTDIIQSSLEASNQPNVAQSPSIQTATKPADQSLFTDRLTWDKTFIKEVRYNPAIQEWINFSPDFANWVRSCIMLHSDNSLDETVCTIPDQWRDDIGDKITIVTTNYIPGVATYRDQYPKHEYKGGVYCVMV